LLKETTGTSFTSVIASHMLLLVRLQVQ